MDFIDLTGCVYGRLTVVALAGVKPVRWKCVCVCGGSSVVKTGPLRSGNTTSCGCRKRAVLGESTTKHGGTGTRLYSTWKGLMSRCYNKNIASYANYGGRGIKVCVRWHNFANFRADMGEPPEGCTLDRLDNSKGYSPKNCRWATRAEQSRNTRRNIRVVVAGVSWLVHDFAIANGVSGRLAKTRIYNGWEPLAACTVMPRTSVKGARGKVLRIQV